MGSSSFSSRASVVAKASWASAKLPYSWTRGEEGVFSFSRLRLVPELSAGADSSWAVSFPELPFPGDRGDAQETVNSDSIVRNSTEVFT